MCVLIALLYRLQRKVYLASSIVIADIVVVVVVVVVV